jgi:RimJ/RimL family protein N-acetyltransferase/predicted acetyltransferase
MELKIDYPFETKRMKFRLLNDQDLDVVERQFSDSDMCKFFSEPPCDRKEAQEIIEHYKNTEGNYARYGMFDKETEQFIGTVGYHYLDQALKQVEIGYDVWKDFWKKGYLTEALPILLNLCFNDLKVDCVYILTHPLNRASIESARKFGFKECVPCRTPDVLPQIGMKLMREVWEKEEKNANNGFMVETVLATEETANIIRNLYPLYLHDLSEIYGNVPNEYGIYEEEPIKTLAEQYSVQNTWFEKPGLLYPYITYVNKQPAGFALVSTKQFAPDGLDTYLFEFFLLRPYRGKLVAETAAKQVFDRFKGSWGVFTGPTTQNKRAQAFWYQTIHDYTNGQFSAIVGPSFDGEKLKFKFNNN